MAQLRMLYSPALKPLPELVEPAGFELRPLRKEELREWGMKLHPACGFSPKDDAYFEIYLPRVIPGGIMVCAEKSTGRIAASAAAQYSEAEIPGGLGWVMALPEMRGRGCRSARGGDEADGRTEDVPDRTNDSRESGHLNASSGKHDSH